MLAATFFTLQAPEPDHERFSELRCSKVTLGSDPTRVQARFCSPRRWSGKRERMGGQDATFSGEPND